MVGGFLTSHLMGKISCGKFTFGDLRVETRLVCRIMTPNWTPPFAFAHQLSRVGRRLCAEAPKDRGAGPPAQAVIAHLLDTVHRSP